MNSKQRIGLAIGGGVVAVAAAIGVGSAASGLGSTSSWNSPGYGQGAPANQRGADGSKMDTTAMAQALASKLGVSESAMQTALDNAMAANRPQDGPNGSGPGIAPTAESDPATSSQHSAMLAAISRSIATELKLDQSKVLSALTDVWTAHDPGMGSSPTSRPGS